MADRWVSERLRTDFGVCGRCGVELSHLEGWAGVCLVHMTREQSDAIGLAPAGDPQPARCGGSEA